MDEVETPQLILALKSSDFISYRDVILQTLCNRDIRIAPTTNEDSNASSGSGENFISDDDLNTLYSFSLAYLSSNVGAKNIASCQTVNLVCSLLNNLTIDESLAEKFISFLNSDKANLTRFKDSIEQFLRHSLVDEPVECDDWTLADPLQHISSICCNLSRITDGRSIILNVGDGYLKKMSDNIESRNAVRARGCIAAIRTCLFDEKIHWWVLNEVGLLQALLIVLAKHTSLPYTEAEKALIDPEIVAAGPKFDKDDDVEVNRKNAQIGSVLLARTDIFSMILECILLLCQTKMHRETMRKKKVYVIVRNFDSYLNIDDEVDAAERAKGSTSAASVFGGFVTSKSSNDAAEEKVAERPPTPLEAAKESLSNIIYEIINFLARDEDPEIPAQLPRDSFGAGSDREGLTSGSKTDNKADETDRSTEYPAGNGLDEVD